MPGLLFCLLIALAHNATAAAVSKQNGNWNSNIWGSTLSDGIEIGKRPNITDTVTDRHNLTINSVARMNTFGARDAANTLTIANGADILVDSNWNGANFSGANLTVTMSGGRLIVNNVFQQAGIGTGVFNQNGGEVRCVAPWNSAGGLKLTGTYNLNSGTLSAERVFAPAAPGAFKANGGKFFFKHYEAAGTLTNTGATFAIGGLNGATGYSKLYSTVAATDINYHQAAGASMEIDINGYVQATEYDVFLANQTEQNCNVYLDGTLLINMPAAFAATVASGSTFNVVRADTLTLGPNFKLGGDCAGLFTYAVVNNHLVLTAVTPDITVDVAEQRQKFLGFGGSVHIGEPALPILYDAGGRWARVGVHFCMDRFNDINLDPSQYEAYFETNIAAGGGWNYVATVWNYCNTMKMTQVMTSYHIPNCFQGGATPNELNAAYVDKYAALWVAAIKCYTNHGYKPDYIEIFNEPDVYSDVPDPDHVEYCPPAVYNLVVKAVRQKLDAAGLQSVKIIGPGIAHIDMVGWEDLGTDRWIAGLDAEGVAAHAAFSTHGYIAHPDLVDDTGPNIRAKFMDGFVAACQSKDPNKPMVLTEFTTFDNSFHGVTYPSPKDNWYNTAALTMAFAARCMEHAFSFLNCGAAGLMYWQACDQSWKPEQLGLAGRVSDGNPIHPVYYAMKTLMPEIAAGSRVVETVVNNPNVYAVALRSGTKLVLGLVNRTNVSQNVVVELKNIDQFTVKKVRSATTTAMTETLANQTCKRAWKVTLPPDGVKAAVIQMFEQDAVPILDVNFNSDPAGGLPSEGSCVDSNDPNLTYKVVSSTTTPADPFGGAGNKSLYLKDQSTSKSCAVDFDTPLPAANWVSVATDVHYVNSGYINIGSGSTYAAKLRLSGTSLECLVGTTWVSLATISANHAYSVAVDLDVPAQKYAVWVNGTQVLANQAFEAAVTHVDRVRLASGSSAGSNSSIYFDNLTVMAVPYLNVNFDADGANGLPSQGTCGNTSDSGLTYKVVASTTTPADPFGGGGNRSLYLMDQSATKDCRVNYDTTVPPGANSVSVAMDVHYVNSANINIGNGTTYAAQLRLGGTSLDCLVGGTWVSKATISANQVYSIIVDLDVVTQKYAVWVNGTQVLANQAFHAAVTHMSRVQLAAGASTATGKSSYFDNLIVTAVP